MSELQQLRRIVGLMRDLHRPIHRGDPMRTLVCRECKRCWPCDTAWKLDGLHEPPPVSADEVHDHCYGGDDG